MSIMKLEMKRVWLVAALSGAVLAAPAKAEDKKLVYEISYCAHGDFPMRSGK